MSNNTKPENFEWDQWLDRPHKWRWPPGPLFWKNAPWAVDVTSSELEMALENLCRQLGPIGAREMTLGMAVQEAKHVLSTFFESGNMNYDIYHSGDPDEQEWARWEIQELRKFIEMYENYVAD